MATKFREIESNLSILNLQEKILDFWKQNESFKKSVDQRSKNPIYSFYDGPPFITGLPHYATLLPSIAKDIIPRYWSMRGKKVRRVWGWDCHGIYAEVQVEKKLGLKSRRDIENMGVDKFVQACRDYVGEISSQWVWYIENVGRWVDMKNAYRTMDKDYMESVIWAFKKAYDEGYIFKGRRTSLYCPRCATPLSNYEVTMDGESYIEIEEETVIVKFRLKDGRLALAWTTTPWTLPGNLALAVNKKLTYADIKFKGDGNVYIVSDDFLKTIKGSYKVLKKYKGIKLDGLEYKPIFDFFNSVANANNFKFYSANFVTGMEGTGIVHVAPNLGEDDFLLGNKHNLSQINSVDEMGRLSLEVTPWAKDYFRDANPKITQYLKENGMLYSLVKHSHRYPFCHRCSAPLIYRAQDAWYVNITKIRTRMLDHNKKINWVPDYFKHGRFEHNIKNAPDWCISRTRYWGTPIPVWECDCGNKEVFGSIKDIEERSGQKIVDLHRPDIDNITINCSKCNKKMQRVREVLDPWFESGSMPFAERHYPFENKKEFLSSFPADFISEYTGQLRAWFYYLLAVSTMIFDSHPFKNVVVTGVLLGNDGRKMSKSLGNYPDPKGVLTKYGGDALRLFLMASPIMSGEDISVTENDISEHYKKSVLILWNSYRYFITYANSNSWLPSNKENKSKDILDIWILSRLTEYQSIFSASLENYDYITAAKAFRPFVEDLSTWYIRRSRSRFVDGDIHAFNTLYRVLLDFSVISSPLTPFISEEIFNNLTFNKLGSVHLKDFPKGSGEIKKDTKSLLENMQFVRFVVEKAHSQRHALKLKLRQPLLKLTVYSKFLSLNAKFVEILKEETNVKKVEFKKSSTFRVKLDSTMTKDLEIEGFAREIVRSIQEARKEFGCGISDLVRATYPNEKNIKIAIAKYKKEIMEKTLTKDLFLGNKYEVFK